MAEPNSLRLGTYITHATGSDQYRSFLPPPLPPQPPIELSGLISILGEADRALGRLDGISRLLPDPALFIYMYVRKEALLSSQIEGTQSTIDELLRFEAEAIAGEPVDDIREVSNYVDAITYGLERLNTLPLSLRLIRELHARLLNSGRGHKKSPGEFRRTQNWIGGSRPGNAMFVPPSVDQLPVCLDALEKFFHEQSQDMPPLIKAGLIHVQFETIHPFLDGNGRLGRLLITLLLSAEKVLAQPLLYLSLYFKLHREDYYRLLQEVRDRGAWEAWLDFFLTGVASTADQAYNSAIRLLDLFEADRKKIASGGDRAGSTLRLHEALRKSPYLNAQKAAKITELSMPTVNSALAELQRLSIIKEVTGKRRNRVYAYSAYLSILAEGAEPIR